MPEWGKSAEPIWFSPTGFPSRLAPRPSLPNQRPRALPSLRPSVPDHSFSPVAWPRSTPEAGSAVKIFDALERRETYGTSGPRILLWFDLLDPNAPGGAWPMGSEVAIAGTPTFQVRAAGSFEQKPGCPDSTSGVLSEERLASLCMNECYYPSEDRRPIVRIEVIRIRTQIGPDEAIAPLN